MTTVLSAITAPCAAARRSVSSRVRDGRDARSLTRKGAFG